MGYGGVFLSPDVFQKYLNYFSWPKNSNGRIGEWGMVYFLSPDIFQKYLNYFSWPKNSNERKQRVGNMGGSVGLCVGLDKIVTPSEKT